MFVISITATVFTIGCGVVNEIREPNYNFFRFCSKGAANGSLIVMSPESVTSVAY